MTKKILVLRGGPSSEYEVSLKTGKSVLDNLSQEYLVTDCVVDKEGNWIIKGITTPPRVAVQTHDVVFNAMHGEYGEDGKVQRLLENLGAKFTGPGSLGASMAMNKILSKEVYTRLGIKTPIHKILSKEDCGGNIEQQAITVFRSFTMPVVLKPVDKGSSIGVTLARDYQSLVNSLINLYVRYDKILVEEYIAGKEATVGVIEEFRNKKHYSLFPIEIKRTKSIFDYDEKYHAEIEHLCPGSFSEEEKIKMQEFAAMAHQALDLRHYSRSDFVVHPKRGIYLLETNSLPGLTESSLLPKAIKAVGVDYKAFLKHIIDLS